MTLRSAAERARLRSVIELYRYVWHVSGRAQLALTALSVCLFLLDLAPIELQRRIINGAVDHRPFGVLATLCVLYAATALAQGGMKLLSNIYRGSIVETANRRLRLDPYLRGIAGGHGRKDRKSVV